MPPVPCETHAEKYRLTFGASGVRYDAISAIGFRGVCKLGMLFPGQKLSQLAAYPVPTRSFVSVFFCAVFFSLRFNYVDLQSGPAGFSSRRTWNTPLWTGRNDQNYYLDPPLKEREWSWFCGSGWLPDKGEEKKKKKERNAFLAAVECTVEHASCCCRTGTLFIRRSWSVESGPRTVHTSCVIVRLEKWIEWMSWSFSND